MGEVSGGAWQPTVPAMLQMVAGGGGPRLRAAFAEASLDDIRPAQAMALVPLASGPLHASALAERLGVTRQAVAQLVRPLERYGYVDRSPDAVDARALLVGLTPRGRAALRVMRANAVAIEHDWRQMLGPERLDQLRQTLQILLAQDPRRTARPTD